MRSAFRKEIKGIGLVLFERSRRAKGLNITVKPNRGVRVAVPMGISFKIAERFVKEKKEWIFKCMKKVEKLERPQPLYDINKEIRTREHKLKVSACPGNRITARIRNGVIDFRYPEELPVSDQRIQENIKLAIRETYRMEAKVYLPKRVDYFAEKHNFVYNRLFIKNQVSRWGSCSNRNNINLNLNLMRLPDDLVDYVILHELLHTKIKNHSLKFWEKLSSFFPDVKNARARLNQYNLRNY